MQQQRTATSALAQPLRTILHAATANGLEPYRRSRRREHARGASLDTIRASLARWEIDRLACVAIKHRKTDLYNFDAREPLLMRYEELRLQYGNTPRPAS